MKSKISKACDISPSVRREVLERDGCRCIICGRNRDLQIAHYISRARLGLGIPENLGTMCIVCHFQYDNGKMHNEIKKAFENYLKTHYPDWNTDNLRYSKY